MSGNYWEGGRERHLSEQPQPSYVVFPGEPSPSLTILFVIRFARDETLKKKITLKLDLFTRIIGVSTQLINRRTTAFARLII